jgi:hypothetical protein
MNENCVKWLIETLQKNEFIPNPDCSLDLSEIIKEAEKMHQQEINHAYVYGAAYGIDIKNGIGPINYYKEKFEK